MPEDGFREDGSWDFDLWCEQVTVNIMKEMCIAIERAVEEDIKKGCRCNDG
jgi:hypothetical protein